MRAREARVPAHKTSQSEEDRGEDVLGKGPPDVAHPHDGKGEGERVVGQHGRLVQDVARVPEDKVHGALVVGHQGKEAQDVAQDLGHKGQAVLEDECVGKLVEDKALEEVLVPDGELVSVAVLLGIGLGTCGGA